jgi:hypothetical protein
MIATYHFESLNRFFNKPKMLSILPCGLLSITLETNALLIIKLKVNKLCNLWDLKMKETFNTQHNKTDMTTITKIIIMKETKIVESKVDYLHKNISPISKNLYTNLEINLFKASNEGKIVNLHFKKIIHHRHHLTLMKWLYQQLKQELLLKSYCLKVFKTRIRVKLIITKKVIKSKTKHLKKSKTINRKDSS